MENPTTWSDAEKIIQRVYLCHIEEIYLHHQKGEPVAGFSLYRQIADALREAGLLAE